MPNPNTPVYPSALATDLNLMVASNRAIAQLVFPLDSVSSSFTVTNGTVFTTPCLVQVDTEIILIGSKTGNLMQSCTRGFSSTSAAAHGQNADVKGYVLAYHHNQVSAEIQAIETALGVNLGNVVTNPAAGPVTIGSTVFETTGFPATVQTIKTTISSAQLVTLTDTVSIQLLPAVAGKSYWIQSSYCYWHANTTPYTFTGSFSVAIPGQDLSTDTALFFLFGIVSSTSSTDQSTIGYGEATLNLSPSIVGQAINLYAENGPMTGGDGTLDIYLVYMLI